EGRLATRSRKKAAPPASRAIIAIGATSRSHRATAISRRTARTVRAAARESSPAADRSRAARTVASISADDPPAETASADAPEASSPAETARPRRVRRAEDGSMVLVRQAAGLILVLQRRHRPPDVFHDAAGVILAAVLRGDGVAPLGPDATRRPLDPGVAAGE